MLAVAGAWGTILAAARLRLGFDDAQGVQKIHAHKVPRLGGIPIAIAAFAGLALQGVYQQEAMAPVFMVCALPILVVGLWEDITRRVDIWPRVLAAMASAFLSFWLLDARFAAVGIPVLDEWLAIQHPAVLLAITLFAVSGVAHSTNLIDGCNGLSSGVSIIVLVALGCIAYQVNDQWLFESTWILAAATLGFFVLNWPSGRLFLGDAGAYFLGFSIAVFSLMLVARNPEVSPWAPLLLMIYPVWETLFTIIRRVWALGIGHVGRPDTLHLHQIIYRRLVRRYGLRPQGARAVMRNSMTSPYLWALSLLCATPAAVFWARTELLMALTLLFVGTYLALYRRIIQFKSPRWLVSNVTTSIPPRHAPRCSKTPST